MRTVLRVRRGFFVIRSRYDATEMVQYIKVLETEIGWEDGKMEIAKLCAQALPHIEKMEYLIKPKARDAGFLDSGK